MSNCPFACQYLSYILMTILGSCPTTVGEGTNLCLVAIGGKIGLAIKFYAAYSFEMVNLEEEYDVFKGCLVWGV